MYIEHLQGFLMLPKSFTDFDSSDLSGMRSYLLNSPQNEIFKISELQRLKRPDDEQLEFIQGLFNQLGDLKGKTWKNLLGQKTLEIEKPFDTDDEGLV